MKNNEPLLSVIVPIYNVENYLERCIDSIIGQSYTNLEIILVDDGSTDDSSRLCKEYACKDNRIKVLYKENGGIVSARKAGIEIATGKYATYVDSDDWIEANMYCELIELIEKHQADIVTSGVYRDYGKNVVKENDNLQEGVYSRNEIINSIYPKVMYCDEFYKAGINIHIYNKIYKCTLIKGKQLSVDNQIRVGDDAAVVYPCVFDAEKIVISHNSYYHYCIRDNSIMGMEIGQEFERIQLLYKYLLNEVNLHDRNEILKKQLNYLILYLLLLKEPQKVIKVNNDDKIELLDNLVVGSKVVLYGAGKFGKAFYEIAKRNNLCNVVMWVDKKANIHNKVLPAENVIKLTAESYDYIVIGALLESVSEQIYYELLESGIKEDRIIKLNIKDKDVNSVICNILS